MKECHRERSVGHRFVFDSMGFDNGVGCMMMNERCLASIKEIVLLI